MPLIEQQQILTITQPSVEAAVAELHRQLAEYPPVRIISTSIAYQPSAWKLTLIAVVETI